MIIGLNDTTRYGLVNTLIVESSTDHSTPLQSYIHPPPKGKISAITDIDCISCTRVAAPTQLLLTDQSNLTGPTVVKTSGCTEVMTVHSIVRTPSGLATDNLKSVGLTPTLASFNKAEPERRTSTSVMKPCCDESRHHSKSDWVADGCTICSLRVSKEDLLDYEPEGDEVAMEEQEDFFEAFPGERPNLVAGAKKDSTTMLPPDENI